MEVKDRQLSGPLFGRKPVDLPSIDFFRGDLVFEPIVQRREGQLEITPDLPGYDVFGLGVFQVGHPEDHGHQPLPDV